MTVFVRLQENESYELEKAYKCKVKDTFFNPVIKFIGIYCLLVNILIAVQRCHLIHSSMLVKVKIIFNYSNI